MRINMKDFILKSPLFIVSVILILVLNCGRYYQKSEIEEWTTEKSTECTIIGSLQLNRSNICRLILNHDGTNFDITVDPTTYVLYKDKVGSKVNFNLSKSDIYKTSKYYLIDYMPIAFVALCVIFWIVCNLADVSIGDPFFTYVNSIKGIVYLILAIISLL